MTPATRHARRITALLAVAVLAAALALCGCARVHEDVDYGSAFLDCVDGGPATCDIYPAKHSAESGTPVFIYVHGGGYIGGDKALDDPAAMGQGVERMVLSMQEAGWTVVSMNYALAPAYVYPTPVIQLAELVQYLQANAEELGIDPTRIALGGGSAGGQIAAQFTACQCDAAYAEEVGVPQVLDPGCIKALYLGCALIDPTLFAQTGDEDNDAKFAQMQAAYFTGDSAAQANLLERVGEGFPPTYIVDCDEASFAAQARELAELLDGLGVRNELRIYEGQYHGFDASGREDATSDAVHGWLAFIR